MLQSNLTNIKVRDDIYMSINIEKTLQIAFHSLGLIGELLMFVVYYQTSLRKLSVSVYFRSMALVGIFQSAFYFTVMEILNSDFTIPIIQAAVYINNLYVPISAWLEVAASFDRFVTISFPMRFRFTKKPLVQRATVLILIIYNMAFYANTINSGRKKFANWKDRLGFLNTLWLMDLLNGSVVPFTLMMIISVAMLVGVVRVHHRLNSRQGARNVTSAQQKLMRDIKFGVTIVVLNLLFFIFIGLNRLRKLFFFNPFDMTTQAFGFLIFESAFNNMSEFYYLSQFYVQLAVNNLVRGELLKIFIRMINTFTEKIPFLKVKFNFSFFFFFMSKIINYNI